MKKTTIVFILSFISAVCFAKPKVEPDWFKNYRIVFPNSEYLAQRGSGVTAEDAKTDGLSQLARYFQSSVSANLSTTMSSITTNSYILEETRVLDEVNVKSQVDFFGLEFTEPFYYKAEKKWYCVVYINRENAWNQYKPQIDMAKNTFNGLYKNIDKEEDFIIKLSLCKKAWDSGKVLLEKLEYGRIINPVLEAAYEEDREYISEIPVLFENAKNQCSINVHTSNDYNNYIFTSVSEILRKNGFTIEKNFSVSNYIAEIVIVNNVNGENPLSIKPTVDIKIISKNNKTVFSCEIIAAEKTVAYTLENAQKKSYSNLIREIELALNTEFSSKLSL